MKNDKKNFEKRKAHLSFIDNSCGTDLADIQLMNKFDKGIRFLLCYNMIWYDIFSKYACVLLWKIQDVLWQAQKIWVNKGSRFYNKPMKPWLHDNDIETYSTQNKGKCVVAERSIRTLKS